MRMCIDTMRRTHALGGCQRGQGATEFLIILAVLLMVFLILLQVQFDVLTLVTKQSRHAKARAAIDDLGDAAELVYQQGPGARTKVYIALPNTIDRVAVANKTLAVSFFGEQDTLHRSFGFDINGTLPTEEGFYWIIVEAIDDAVRFNATGVLTVASPQAACGNNVKEPGEQCDGTALGGQSCAGLGFSSGTLSCTAGCSYDTSACVADITPPGSVGNLLSPVQGTTWIYWTWSNPIDADFSRAIIFIDGVNVANTSDAFYNATGFSPDTAHTLTLHTKDLAGNINAADVNSTNRTLPLPPASAVLFYDDFESWGAGECAHPGIWTLCSQGDGHITRNNKNVYNGTWVAQFDDHDSDTDSLTACLDLGSYSAATLEFAWVKEGLDAGEYGKLDINTSVSGYGEAFSSGSGTSSYARQTVDLTPYLSTETCIRFHALADLGADRFYLDDVRITAQS